MNTEPRTNRRGVINSDDLHWYDAGDDAAGCGLTTTDENSTTSPDRVTCQACIDTREDDPDFLSARLKFIERKLTAVTMSRERLRAHLVEERAKQQRIEATAEAVLNLKGILHGFPADRRGAIAGVLADVVACHPMWIDDNGEGLDYLPQREKRIADFVDECAEQIDQVLGQPSISQAMRRLHSRFQPSPDSPAICRGCSEPWPCRTTRVLNDTMEVEA